VIIQFFRNFSVTVVVMVIIRIIGYSIITCLKRYIITFTFIHLVDTLKGS